MADATLLIIGCAVTFTAMAGAYVALRGGFEERKPSHPEAVTARNTKPLRPLRKPKVA